MTRKKHRKQLNSQKHNQKLLTEMLGRYVPEHEAAGSAARRERPVEHAAVQGQPAAVADAEGGDEALAGEGHADPAVDHLGRVARFIPLRPDVFPDQAGAAVGAV